MGTKERRAREAEARRRDILAAAKRLFFERGFADATMPDIAAAAELAPGTLYLYFPAKSALYAELLMEGYAILRQRLEAAAAQSGNTSQRAGAMVDAFLDFAREQPEYFRVIFFILQSENTAGRKAALDREQIDRLKREEDSCKHLAGAVLLEAMRHVPAKEALARVNAVWAMLAGVVFFWNGEPEYKAVTREARKLILDMLARGR